MVCFCLRELGTSVGFHRIGNDHKLIGRQATGRVEFLDGRRVGDNSAGGLQEPLVDQQLPALLPWITERSPAMMTGTPTALAAARP